MKKALLIASVLFIAVISTACINNIAVQELNNKAAEYMQKGDFEAAVNRLQASIDLDDSMYERKPQGNASSSSIFNCIYMLSLLC